MVGGAPIYPRATRAASRTIPRRGAYADGGKCHPEGKGRSGGARVCGGARVRRGEPRGGPVGLLRALPHMFTSFCHPGMTNNSNDMERTIRQCHVRARTIRPHTIRLESGPDRGHTAQRVRHVRDKRAGARGGAVGQERRGSVFGGDTAAHIQPGRGRRPSASGRVRRPPVCRDGKERSFRIGGT